jgi:hypothetical protein
MKTHAVLSALLVVAGCAGAAPYGIDSPWYHYPANTVFVLRRDLEVPPGSATVRMQYGKVVARNGVQEVDPHCILEISTVGDAAQTVHAGEFEVIGVNRWASTIATGFGTGLAVRFAMDGSGSGPTQIFFKTEFRLRSAAQPGVRSLTCQSDQNAPGVAPYRRHLTPAEIQSALGGLADLRLPLPQAEP